MPWAVPPNTVPVKIIAGSTRFQCPGIRRSGGDAFHTCSVGLHSSRICFFVSCTCTRCYKKKSETISLISTVSIICVRFFCNYKI